MAIESTGKKCVVCKVGDVVKETTQKYFGDPMQARCGDAGMHQLTTLTAHFCDCCGVSYRRPPPPRCRKCREMTSLAAGHMYRCTSCGELTQDVEAERARQHDESSGAGFTAEQIAQARAFFEPE